MSKEKSRLLDNAECGLNIVFTLLLVASLIVSETAADHSASSALADFAASDLAGYAFDTWVDSLDRAMQRIVLINRKESRLRRILIIVLPLATLIAPAVCGHRRRFAGATLKREEQS